MDTERGDGVNGNDTMTLRERLRHLDMLMRRTKSHSAVPTREMTADETLFNDFLMTLDKHGWTIFADVDGDGKCVGFTAYENGCPIVHVERAEGC